MEANVESMQNLYDNMSEYGYDLTKIPFIIQYNKRDLPNAAPIKDLQSALNPGWPIEDGAQQKITPDPTHAGENLVEKLDNQWIGRAPYLEAVGGPGDRVVEPLKTVVKTGLKTLTDGVRPFAGASATSPPPRAAAPRRTAPCSRASTG